MEKMEKFTNGRLKFVCSFFHASEFNYGSFFVGTRPNVTVPPEELVPIPILSLESPFQGFSLGARLIWLNQGLAILLSAGRSPWRWPRLRRSLE